MPFVEDILKYRSVSIVGLHKNAGKTVALNHILGRLPAGLRVAVTSIGTDGERRDIVAGTQKPEIYLRPGTVFATAESYFAACRPDAEIVGIAPGGGTAGGIVTARMVTGGKVLLSGPSSMAALRGWMDSVRAHGTELTLVDGALSRVSSASPAVSEAMVLATGAALSANMDTLVRETAFRVDLIRLPKPCVAWHAVLPEQGRGAWVVTERGVADAAAVGIETACGVAQVDGMAMEYGVARAIGELSGPELGDDAKQALESARGVYIRGAFTSSVWARIKALCPLEGLEVVVDDFTKVFVTRDEYGEMTRRGVRLAVLARSVLIAITVNPVAPSGVRMDSREMCRRIEEQTGVPAYDVKLV